MVLRLRSWRSQLPWLKDAPFRTLQQALKDLDPAFKNFFGGRADFPTFKKKGRSESFRFPDPAQFMCSGQVNSDTAIGCFAAIFCSKVIGETLPSTECSLVQL